MSRIVLFSLQSLSDACSLEEANATGLGIYPDEIHPPGVEPIDFRGVHGETAEVVRLGSLKSF